MGSNIQLSKRLSAIGEMVTEGNRLVDVGCDHGYLPVYLVMNHRIPGAIAADVGKGPLERAREHICRYHMQNYIETRLCDGLSGISVGEGDTLVIAGMGGPLMERILTDGQSVRDSFSEMILQPQSDIPHFRRFIQSQGFQIVEEKMVEEEGKFYPMMRVVRTCPEGDGNENLVSEAAPYTLEEAFGKFLLKEHNPVLYRYLLREERIRADILKQLQAAPQAEAVTARIREVKEEAQLIKAALAEYESK